MRDAIEGYVMFYYDRGRRGHDVARKLLGSYTGMVQSDGYEAYDQFEGRKGITMYGCWAHARCKAVDVNPRLWMEDVLKAIPYYLRDGLDMSELLPLEWKKRNNS